MREGTERPGQVRVPIGRDVEARRLIAALERSAVGRAVAVFLTGEAGIGKTTLLEWTQERAVRDGTLTIALRVPSMTAIPAGFLLSEVLRGAIAAVRRRGLPEPPGLGDFDGERLWDAGAVVRGADLLAALGPIAIFVDDIGWAPPEAAERLFSLARLTAGPLLLVGSVRTGDLREGVVPESGGDLPVEVLHLEALDESAVAAVAEDSLGGPVMPGLGKALARATDGNPLHLTEMLRHWRDVNELVSVGGYWGLRSPTTASVPSSLRDTIAGRLAAIPAAELDLLRVMAILGREASTSELSRMTPMGRDELLAVIGWLHGKAFISETTALTPGLRIAHPLHSSGVIEQMSVTEQRAIHERVFFGLREDASPSERAHHALNALQPPQQLNDVLLEAAEEAEASGSYGQAALWFGRLAEITSDRSLRGRALHRQAANTHHSDPRAAITMVDEALRIIQEPGARGNLLLSRATAHRKVGELDAAMQDLEAAREISSDDEIVAIDLSIGSIAAMLGDLDRAERIFQNAVRITEGGHDHWSALDHLAILAGMRGSLEECRDLLQRAFQHAPSSSDQAFIIPNLARLHLIFGDWKEAQKLLDVAIPLGEAANDTWKLVVLRTTAAHLEASQGRFGAALEHAARAGELAEELGNPAFKIDHAVALGFTLLEAGAASEALDAMENVPRLLEIGAESHDPAFALSTLGEAALRSSSPRVASTYAGMARDRLAEDPTWEIVVDRLIAEVALASGDVDGAHTACARWEVDAPQAPFEHGRALETLARVYLARRDRARALETGTHARDIFAGLGALHRLAEIERWLEVHQPRRVGRPRSTLPLGLTPREAQVLRLVAKGMTNREAAQELGISAGTVKRHVENLIAKCGVKRRTELVGLAMSLSLPETP